MKRAFAVFQKGGVIMDVTNGEQAKIAEAAGAVAVMALERIPADIKADGGCAAFPLVDQIPPARRPPTTYRSAAVAIPRRPLLTNCHTPANRPALFQRRPAAMSSPLLCRFGTFASISARGAAWRARLTRR